MAYTTLIALSWFLNDDVYPLYTTGPPRNPKLPCPSNRSRPIQVNVPHSSTSSLIYSTVSRIRICMQIPQLYEVFKQIQPGLASHECYRSGRTPCAVDEHMMNMYPFILPVQDAVAIMDKRDEANYLLDLAVGVAPYAVVLDLGEGSGQIVFELQREERENAAEGRRTQHPNPGYGLKSARGTPREVETSQANSKRMMASKDIGSFEACKHVSELVMVKDVCVSLFLVGVVRLFVN
ncbi:hypothetical protein V8B97DRAFT_2041271 [Scleroderma yunnanense]